MTPGEPDLDETLQELEAEIAALEADLASEEPTTPGAANETPVLPLLVAVAVLALAARLHPAGRDRR